MTDSKLFFDTSAWFAYFFNEKKEVQQLLDTVQHVYASPLSLFEIKVKLLRHKFSVKDIEAALSFVRRKAILVQLQETIMDIAAEYSVRHKLAALDALIYASSQFKQTTLITLDHDFKHCPNVKVL